MLARLLHVLMHDWAYVANPHGGKPMQRFCRVCGARQRWNYDAARERGRVIWENLP